MESFSVIFYETPNGEQPAKLFLNELSEKQRAKTIRDLKLLETCGNKLREPTSKFLESGIYELRTKQGSNICSNISRILYFFFVGKRIVLTNGFVKKSMKTPRNAIELALKYKQDYIERYT